MFTGVVTAVEEFAAEFAELAVVTDRLEEAAETGGLVVIGIGGGGIATELCLLFKFDSSLCVLVLLIDGVLVIPNICCAVELIPGLCASNSSILNPES